MQEVCTAMFLDKLVFAIRGTVNDSPVINGRSEILDAGLMREQMMD